MTQSPQTNAKGFSKAFWVSNTVELFERMAYYAVFIVLTIYLSNILGFNDFEASMISGLFSGGLYLLPIFTGAYADKIGFRKSMIIAFSLLSAGYLGLGVLPTLLEAAGLVEYGEVTRFSGLADSSERWMIVRLSSCSAVRSSNLSYPHRLRKKPPKQPAPVVIQSFI